MRWTQGQYADYIAKQPKATKPSKYKNVITEVDGIKFHSKAEATRYSQLKILERSGYITDLELQPKYTFPVKYLSGRTITYAADFRYKEDGTLVVEDVKGVQTPAFKIKAGMMMYFFDIKVLLT
jgi:ribosomal protein S8